MRKGNIYFTREKHSAGYTCISNKCLQDTRLSLKARGLLVQILSLPENWILYKSEIGKYNADKKHSINTAIAELETLGYLFSKKIKGNLFLQCALYFYFLECLDHVAYYEVVVALQ